MIPADRWGRCLMLIALIGMWAQMLAVSADPLEPGADPPALTGEFPFVSRFAQDEGMNYAAIRRTFLLEEYETVLNVTDGFLADAPERPEVIRVWIWRALSFDRLQRTDDSLRTLDQLKRRLGPDDPAWPEVLYWEGDISRRASMMLRAKLAWSRLLERYPSSSWASDQVQLGMGLVYVSQQAYDAALEHFRAIERRDPDEPVALEIRLLEGLCLLRLDRFDESLAIFQPLQEMLRRPDHVAQASFYLGEVQSALGRHAEAIAAYRRSIDARPKSTWSNLSRFGLGWSEFQVGRCEESLATFAGSELPAGAAYETEARFAQGSCLARLGKDARAAGLFREILSDDPDHPLGFESGLLLAEIARRSGHPALAADLLERLLEDTEDGAARRQVQLRLGALRLDRGDALAAAAHFLSALDWASPLGASTESGRRAPRELVTHLGALNGLGDVHMHLGEFTEAGARYEETIRLASRPAAARSVETSVHVLHRYARYQQGRVHYLLGQRAAAVSIFERLMSQPRHWPAGDGGLTDAQPPLADDARLALVLIHLNEDQDERARALLELVRRRRSHDSHAASRAAYYLATIALGDGREQDARHLLRESVAGAPRTDEGVDARILLAELDAGRGDMSLAVAGLRDAFDSPALPARHRGQLAKILGDFSRQTRAYADAIRWYELARDLTPLLSGEATYRLASCYEEGGDIDTAISRFRAVPASPWRVRGQLAAAKLLQRQERWTSAESIYESLAFEPIPEAKVAREMLARLRDVTAEGVR